MWPLFASIIFKSLAISCLKALRLMNIINLKGCNRLGTQFSECYSWILTTLAISLIYCIIQKS